MNIPEILSRINQNSRLLTDGNISEMDRDILLDDLRSFYLYAKGTTATVQNVIIEQPQTIIAETQVIIPVVEKEVYVAPIVEVIRPLQEVTVLPIMEQKPIIVNDIMVEKEVLKTEIKEEPKPEPVKITAPVERQPERVIEFVQEESKTKGSSLNEVFAGEERSLNDRLSGDKKSVLNDHVGRKDLKGMIDFNKQYILTNELFKGDSQAFQTAISRINEAPNIEAAFEYIKTDLLPVYKWNGEMQSARLFDKLVRQKFGV